MRHEFETGREWVRIERAGVIANRGRTTLFRWIRAGFVRSEKVRGKTFVRLPDVLATEAAIHRGEKPEIHS